jgi:hypothetical protein
MSRKQRCAACGGNLLRDYEKGPLKCISCGRSPEPEQVSMAEALLSNSTPLDAVGDKTGAELFGPREQVPLSVSMERAARWGRGETAV